jgi:3-oxoacyl-[acyl-carrier protein] reductase
LEEKMSLNDRVVVITGATGGLGQVVSRYMAERGANLVLLGRDAERLRNLALDIGLPDDRYLIQATDLSDPDGARIAAKNALVKYGKIHILLHLVGGWTGGKTVTDTDADAVSSMLKQHVWTTLYLAQSFIPQMVENKWGRILVISSPFASSPRAKGAPYAMGKAAQEALMLTLAQELKGTGVTSNILLVKTIDVKHARENYPSPKNASWTTPEEITDAIVYLVSDEAQMVNGARLPIFGSP